MARERRSKIAGNRERRENGGKIGRLRVEREVGVWGESFFHGTLVQSQYFWRKFDRRARSLWTRDSRKLSLRLLHAFFRHLSSPISFPLSRLSRIFHRITLTPLRLLLYAPSLSRTSATLLFDSDIFFFFPPLPPPPPACAGKKPSLLRALYRFL